MSRLMNLRKRARVCYHEPEEPPFDEYVFCTECRDYVYEYCSIHGALLVIPDDKVGANTGFPAFVPRAALTVPRVFLHLAYSRIPGAGLGVFSSLTLPAGVRFGPYRGQHVQSIGDSNYGWQIFDRSHKPLHIVDARDPNNSNWMRYVNCSRHHAEQNLVAYQYQGQLYYRTVAEVPRFAELLVFYGSEFARRLGVDTSAYNRPCPCPKCQARHLAAKKTKSSKTNKRKAPVEEKKEKTIEKIAKTNSAKINPGTSAASQELSSTPDIREATPEEPAGSSSASEVNTLTAETNFKCEKCGKSFNIKSDLEKHVNTHMPMKASTSRKHEKSRHGVKYFACNECEFATKHARSLQTHLRTHTGEKPFKCSECSSAFTTSGNLQAHLRTHTGEKPFKCSECSSAFTTSGNLQAHLRKHTGEKPYKCKQCSSTFTQSNSLQRHLRTHSGEKPFECNICDYKTIDSGNLKTHLMSRHSGQKPFACDACSYRGATRGHLRQHMKWCQKSA